MVSRFAKEIRDDHGLLDRKTADSLTRLLKTSVTHRRKPGRRPTPEVLKAAKFRAQGVPWPKVYVQVFPGFWSLPFLDRFWRTKRLRDAVRARERRRQRRQSPDVNRQPEQGS